MALSDVSPIEAALQKILGAVTNVQVGAPQPVTAAPTSVASALTDAAAPAAAVAPLAAAPSQRDQRRERWAARGITDQAGRDAFRAARGSGGVVAPAASTMPDYKSYNEYYAGNPEALRLAGVLTNANPNYAIQANPAPSYQYRSDYNKYLSTLPTEYQALGRSNILGSAVQSGAITGVYDPRTNAMYKVGPGVSPGTRMK